jgi:cytochrome c-type biogenesis protein
MSETLANIAGSGSMLLAILVAILAGLLSFFSPCVVPLLPGYMSYVTGLSGVDIVNGEAKRGHMLAGAILFVLGFSAVFVALGAASGALGGWLVVNSRALSLLLGLLTIGLGLVFLGAVPWLQRDYRLHTVPRVGLSAAPFLGVLFGVGWTPCAGPTIGVISTLAFNEAQPGRGALLLGFYSLGLGIPFIVAALAWRRAMSAFSVLRRHSRLITRLGGLMLIVVGVLLVTDWWLYLTTWLQVSVGGLPTAIV